MMPAAATSSTSTHRSDERREEVDDVEVVDEVVGQSTMVRARTDSRLTTRLQGWAVTDAATVAEPRSDRRGTTIVGGGATRQVSRRRASKRSRRATTSAATSVIGRPLPKARARSRSSASSTEISSCAATMPDAWWTTNRKLPLASRPGARRPGAASACIPMIARAATPARTTASACWSSVNGPGRSRYRLSAPTRTWPTDIGNPNTARTPASTADLVNSAHRDVAGSARSGSTTAAWSRWASMHGPSPRVYCNSSISALTSLVVHTDPCGVSPDKSMMPAPLISVSSAETLHRRVTSPVPSSRARRASTRSRRSAGISRTERALSPRHRVTAAHPWRNPIVEVGGGRRGPDRTRVPNEPSFCSVAGPVPPTGANHDPVT